MTVDGPGSFVPPVRAADAPPVVSPARGAPSAGTPAPPVMPTERPPDVDPTLWAQLTEPERVFFSALHDLGPVTYGRTASDGAGAGSTAPLGQRIDVRA